MVFGGTTGSLSLDFSPNGPAPAYFSKLLHPYRPSCSLRSSDLLLSVPKTKSKLKGGCAFAAVAPKTWNDRPLLVRQGPSLSLFKSRVNVFSHWISMRCGHPCDWGACVVWLWDPPCEFGMSFHYVFFGAGGLCALAMRVLGTWRSSFTHPRAVSAATSVARLDCIYIYPT